MLPFLVIIINTIFTASKFPTINKNIRNVSISKINNHIGLSSLRPISILSGLSKVVQNVQARLFNEYSNTVLQHRTDADEKCTVLVTLNFSKAFGTINHRTFLLILKSYSVCNQYVRLLQSYCPNRSQTVKLAEQVLLTRLITSRVSQGSILGPLLFTKFPI